MQEPGGGFIHGGLRRVAGLHGYDVSGLSGGRGFGWLIDDSWMRRSGLACLRGTRTASATADLHDSAGTGP
jgi:hypothetical protein